VSGLHDQEVRFPTGAGDLSLLVKSRTSSGAHPAYRAIVSVVLSAGIKQPKRDVDASPPSVAEVYNGYSHTSPAPMCLKGVYRDGSVF
jgi:hypothetical protein